MTSRKGQSRRERKQRFDMVLAVLSGNPLPLSVPGLVAMLREAGYEIDDETPKKWGVRGIPEKWARRIADFPRAQESVLTARWMRDGTEPGPTKRGRMAPTGDPVRETSPGYTASGTGEEDAAYLRTALEVSRALSNADRESLPLEAKLRLIDLAEKVMVPVYGKRAKTFLDDERARLRGGEDGGGRSSS